MNCKAADNEIMGPKSREKCKSVLGKIGVINAHQITKSLQGAIYKGFEAASNRNVVIKVTNRVLHTKRIGTVNNEIYKNIKENILSEAAIMNYLVKQDNFPRSIVKYYNLLQRYTLLYIF